MTIVAVAGAIWWVGVMFLASGASPRSTLTLVFIFVFVFSRLVLGSGSGDGGHLRLVLGVEGGHRLVQFGHLELVGGGYGGDGDLLTRQVYFVRGLKDFLVSFLTELSITDMSTNMDW